jgi:hypothetical protein
MTEGALGRLPPSTDEHVQKYPLTAGTMPSAPTPVVLGMNWYTGFDRPVQGTVSGTLRYWIGINADWGRVRGGHAVCLKPPGVRDNDAWWHFYDQGQEGACVGFAASRMMTLLNRERYDGRLLYKHAQRIDEWPGEAYSGTSVPAGMDVLRDFGPYDTKGRVDHADGISANRWAGSVAEIAACLSPPDDGKRVLDLGFVDILNSWGSSWPHYVRLSLESLDRLIFRENGDATVVVDR